MYTYKYVYFNYTYICIYLYVSPLERLQQAVPFRFNVVPVRTAKVAHTQLYLLLLFPGLQNANKRLVSYLLSFKMHIFCARNFFRIQLCDFLVIFLKFTTQFAFSIRRVQNYENSLGVESRDLTIY